MEKEEPRKGAAQEQEQEQVEEPRKPKRRPICTRCQRPTPRACICDALPEDSIALEETELVVLVHPKELKHKNRSVPVLELCLDKKHFHFCVGRRLGHETDRNILKLLQPPNITILLYPGEKNKKVVSLSQAKLQLDQRKEEIKSKQESSNGKIVVLALDATWQFAREMHKANLNGNHYPSNMIQVALRSEDFPDSFQPRRFDIRTPPGDNETWMSTAECIAWALSRLESNPDIFSTIMKPLDKMVQKWNRNIQQPKVRNSPRKKPKIES